MSLSPAREFENSDSTIAIEQPSVGAILQKRLVASEIFGFVNKPESKNFLVTALTWQGG